MADSIEQRVERLEEVVNDLGKAMAAMIRIVDRAAGVATEDSGPIIVPKGRLERVDG